MLAAAETTAGSSRRRVSSVSKKRARCAFSGYADSNSAMRLVNRFAVSIWTRSSILSTFWIIRPAPISMTQEMPTSATTTERVKMPMRRLEEPRPSSLSTSLTSVREAWYAGTRPEITPANRVAPSAKSRATGSTAILIQNGGCVSAMAALKALIPDVGEQHAEEGAHQREQHALGEELADQAPAVGAQGGADGDLPGALRGAGHDQAGHVDAGEQQDGKADAQHDNEEGARLFADVLLGVGLDHRAAPLVGLGELLGQGLGDAAQLGPRLVDGDPVAAAGRRPPGSRPGRAASCSGSRRIGTQISWEIGKAKPCGMTPTIVPAWPLTRTLRPTTCGSPL